MRDIVILAIVAAGALMALKRPWIGVMLWTWLSLMNPHRYAWGISYDAPLAAIAACVTLLGVLTTAERRSPFQGAPVWMFLGLVLWVTISFLMGIDVEADYPQWTKVMKIYLMIFVALVLLQNKHHIMTFAWVTAFSLALLGAKGGLFTVLHGGSYRVWGPPGSFIEDNNEFALALVMTIPLLRFLQLQIVARWLRYAMTGVILLCAAAALGSHSRGGLLAIVAMSAVFWWRSQKKLQVGILIILASLVLLPMMPDEWWSRMESIGDYEQDESAQGRLYAWRVAWEVAIHHVFGAGMSFQHPIIFSLYGSGGNIAAHSIYFQVLGNHGFGGLVLFIGLWVSTYRCAGWLRTKSHPHPEATWAGDLGAMVQVSLVGYLVGGAFLSLSYFDLPYNMMVLVVLARTWVQNRGWRCDTDVPLLEYIGLRRPRNSRVAHASNSPT